MSLPAVITKTAGFNSVFNWTKTRPQNMMSLKEWSLTHQINDKQLILNLSIFSGANQKSSSHFHCLKCDYYCTDTNKVVAHRRQHQKLDSIMAAGFEKYTPTQYCATPGCTHNGKQTHYHCRKCQYAVLGLSQMEAHKYRHLNE
jgi:hypothetical protein